MNDAINLSSNAAKTSFVKCCKDIQNYSTEDNNDSDKLDEEDPLSELPSKKKVIRSNKQAKHEIVQSLKI